MMVPRAYTYSKQRSPSGSPTRGSQNSSRKPKLRKGSDAIKGDTSQPRSGSLARAVSSPPPDTTSSSSKPVGIPLSRPPPPTSSPSAPVTVSDKRSDRRQMVSSEREQKNHNDGRTRTPHRSDAMPPSVAAVLAMTNIPPPNRNARRRSGQRITRRVSIDELVQEWRQDELDSARSSGSKHEMNGGSSYGSPMDILLERPWENDVDTEWDLAVPSSAGSTSHFEDDEEFEATGPPLTTRSTSTESMPSLEADDRSLSSLEPITPAIPMSGRSLSEKREKKPLASLTEDAVANHPLLPAAAPSPTFDPSANSLQVPGHKSSKSRRSSTKPLRNFKSNLTASFNALANAAKSFSNFTAPSIPPDDFLSHGLLSPRYASEMRPKFIAGTPTPALRRYLNPNPVPASAVSPAELMSKLHDAMLLDPKESLRGADSTSNGEDSTPMIQMTTYNDRRAGPSSRARRRSSLRGNDVLDTKAAPLVIGEMIRQREPRENSDFLRVIVLEMNMRRGGKLDSKAAMRARPWLPPRPSTPLDPEEEKKVTSPKVPPRWVGISMDE